MPNVLRKYLQTSIIVTICLCSGFWLLAPGTHADTDTSRLTTAVAENPSDTDTSTSTTAVAENLSEIFGVEVGRIGTIAPGQTISGTIDLGGEIDVYRFSVEANDDVRLNLSSKSLHGTILFLHDSSGKIANETYPQQASWTIEHPFIYFPIPVMEWRSYDDREYYVSVFNTRSRDIGGYEITLEVSKPDAGQPARLPYPYYSPSEPWTEDEDDHSDESTAAVAVSVGDEIPFSLHDVEDVDWFKFDAQAGQSYVVSVLGSELSVRLEIQDDNRQVLASGRDYEVSRSRIVYDALTTGERFIKVTPFHRFGTYTLSLNHNEDGESDAVTEITMGEIIESKGLLKFKATEDEVYEIYFLDPAHKVRLALYTPEQVAVMESRYNGAPPYHIDQSLFRWQAESSGYHYLRVFQNGEARYSIRVLDGDYVDDHSDKQEEATELTFGVPVDGEIGTHGDVDFFEVDIDQDQAIGIHVVSDPEARYASIVEIIDPNGQSERVGEMAYHMRVLWRSKVAGKHHVKVQADWDSEVDSVLGAYNIEVELIDSVDEHREDLGLATPISVGDTIQGRISCYGDRDVFRLRTDAQRAYRVKVVADSELEAEAHVIGVSGRSVDRRGYYSPHRNYPIVGPLEWGPSWGGPRCTPIQQDAMDRDSHEVLFQTWHAGDIHIHVAGNYSRTGEYSLILEPIEFDDYGNDRETAYNLASGAQINGTINIPGDYDVFRITAERPKSVVLHWELGSLEDGCLYLMEKDSRDFRVEDEWCISAYDVNEARSATIAWALQEIGEYYLIVSTYDNQISGFRYYSKSTGSYSFSMWEFEIPDDHGDDHETSTPINIGVPIKGRIDLSDDIDVFGFEAEDGDIVRVSVEHNSLRSPDVRLCDVDRCLGSVDYDLENDATTVRDVWRTRRDGPHFITVSASSAGDYTLTTERVDYEDDHGNTQSSATQLTVGLGAEGNLEVIGDVDLFKFDADLGKVYQLVIDPGTIDRREVKLHDSDGLELHNFEDDLYWQAPATGSFYLDVFVPSYWPNTGTYRLTVFEAPDDDHGYDFASATFLDIGETVDASVAWNGDLDYFSFDASQGIQYRVFFEALGFFSISFITLYDSDGSELAQEIHIDEIIWTAPADGTYYFTFEAYSNEGYRAGVEESDYRDDHPDGYHDAAPIAVGESIDGFIGWRDEDWFKFDAEEGVTYHIDIERGTLYNAEPRIIYMRPAETYPLELGWDSIVVDDNTTRIAFTPSQSDEYRIKIAAQWERGWGSYTIRLATSP